MVRIAVCDDEKSVCNYLEKRIRDHLGRLDADAVVSVFADGDELAADYKNGKGEYDIIFLDIKMKRSDGVSAAKIIREYNKEVLIVFVTSSAEYVFTGYEVKAFRYILKTELDHAFDHVFSECLRELEKESEDVYTVKSGAETVVLRLKNILYFESELRKTTAVTAQGSYTCYRKLGDIEEELNGKEFVRCHQSYLVNARLIRSVGAGELTVGEGIVIPVSKSRLKKTKEAFLLSKR